MTFKGGTSVRSLRHILSKMPKRCVEWNCSNVADKTKSIAIHVIPFYGDDRPIAKSRRKQWVDFVRKKKGEKWCPSEHSVIFLRHFAPEDYTWRFDYDGQVERSRQIRDEIGVFSCSSTDGRSANRRWWKYAHRTCKAKGLYRNLTAAPVLFTFIRKTCA